MLLDEREISLGIVMLNWLLADCKGCVKSKVIVSDAGKLPATF